MNQNLMSLVSAYYEKTFSNFGATAKGVDWKDEASQQLRFKQFAQLLQPTGRFSLNDFGCGYGAYFDYLRHHYTADFDYFGHDLCDKMVHAAKQRLSNDSTASINIGNTPEQIADYSVASGIFNVKLNIADKLWYQHILDTLDVMNNHSKKGFAFNCLTSYSDEEKKRKDLYYCDPLTLFDYCKKQFSSRVALLHDYELWEFTVLVRK